MVEIEWSKLARLDTVLARIVNDARQPARVYTFVTMRNDNAAGHWAHDPEPET